MNFKLFYCIFFLFTLNIYSQNIINGKIIDKNENTSIDFVTIAVKGTNKGTYSDEKGNFKIQHNNSLNDTLIFSRIGYKKKEVALVVGDSLTVELEKDILTLKEIIVSPISKKCKKIKFKNKKSNYNEILYEGTIIRRKINIEGNLLCNFSLDFLPNYDNAKVVLRPFLTDVNNNSKLINDYTKEFTLQKGKINKIKFEFNENIFIEDKEIFIGLEIISIPQNDNYSKNIQIICTNDKVKGSEVFSIYNFIQQNGTKMTFDRKFENNIKVDIEVSK